MTLTDAPASPVNATSTFEWGKPYAHNRKMVCPDCSKFTGTPGFCSCVAVITHPVYLVVRINKTTGQKFLGCPNFPRCKRSADVYSVRVDKQRQREFMIDYDDELRPF